MARKIEPNTIIQGDCTKILSAVTEPFADLIFADPPFNIGYKYDVYEDRKAYKDYYDWTQKWMRLCATKALKPTGSFWVAIGDEYAAEVKTIGDSLGLHLRNWVIWHYTFGQNTRRKFARSHAHLFYWVKDPKEFTFNDMAIRVPSDRQREYHDKRASGNGKLPDDVWTEFPRVCGTFNERETWHPCQMPETLLARIIRTCTKTKEHLILDPFAGSGTTLVVAKKTDRDYVGIELSKVYVERIRDRLDSATSFSEIEGERGKAWPEEHVRELQAAYGEAGVPTDKLFRNLSLLQAFARQFNWRIESAGASSGYSTGELWDQLERLRKQAKLPRVRSHASEPTNRKTRRLEASLFKSKGIEMVELGKAQQDHIRELLGKSSVSRDALPYSEEFQRLKDAFWDRTFKKMTDAEFWQALVNVAKKGGIRGKRAPKPAPKLTEEQQKRLIRILPVPIGQRDQLPYSERFEKIVDQFNGEMGSSLGLQEVWLAILAAAK